MFTRTGERKGQAERCVCSCGKESWVEVRRGELMAKSCAACSAAARMRSKPGDPTRTCKVCGNEKIVKEFCKSKTGKYLCLSCKRGQESARYAVDPKKVQYRIAAKYVKQRAFMDSLKSGPCADCGLKFVPCQMDFDHRDPATKVKGLAQMFHWARGKILAEVAKCDLVCANCHRDRTQKTVESEYKVPGYGGEKPLRGAYVPKWQDVPLEGPGKICSKCGNEKNPLNFAPRNEGTGERRQCRMCVGERHHELGRQNIGRLRRQRLERSNGMAAWFESVKDNQPCKDCGVPHRHWRLDYDHLDGKVYKPGRLKNSLHSRALVLAELAKCDLVCARCHRLRTWSRDRARRSGPT